MLTSHCGCINIHMYMYISISFVCVCVCPCSQTTPVIELNSWKFPPVATTRSRRSKLSDITTVTVYKTDIGIIIF